MRIFFLVLLAIGLMTCDQKNKNIYAPNRYLSETGELKFKEQIVRYVAKAPRRVTDVQKYDTIYDEHYNRQVEAHDLLEYYVNKNDEHFFLIARIAPSTDIKWVATGGRLRYGKDKEIIEYEEVFRTWKLFRTDLEIRGNYLFGLMVKEEDLTPYHTATAGFNYIEFPDEYVHFDKESRSWISTRYGSVEEMVYESRDADSLSKKSQND